MKQRKIEAAEKAIEQIALKYGVTENEVRKQINIAMINGLISDDPKIKRFWENVPRAGEIPTPEELIAHLSDMVKEKNCERNTSGHKDNLWTEGQSAN